MEDTADVLQWVAEVAPAVMERSQNEELLMFVVLFLGSADYLKNPFLRAKLVDVRTQPLPLDVILFWAMACWPSPSESANTPRA